MATSQNTLIGRASGSVDGVTFLTIFRKNVMRAKMSHQTNPNTLPQQYQRNRFTQIVGLYQILKPLLAIGFKNRDIKMTIFNTFQKYNMSNAFIDDSGGQVVLVPEKLIISRGYKIPTPIVAIMNYNNSPAITLSWSGGFTPPDSNPFDEAKIFVINATQNVSAITDFAYFRIQGQASTLLPTNIEPGDVIYAWLFFVSNVDGNVSDNVFMSHIAD